MFFKIIPRLIFYSLNVATLLLFVCAATFFFLNYDATLSLLNSFLADSSVPDLENKLKNQLFTPEIYSQTRNLLLIASIILFILAMVQIKIKKPLIAFIELFFFIGIQFVLSECLRFLKLPLNRVFYVVIFLIIFFYVKINQVIYFPFTYDESYTYLHFCNPGVLVSASYFPNTNNHVFFSILGSIINKISPFSPIITLRLISLFFSTLSVWILYRILITRFSFIATLSVVVIFSFAYPNFIQHTQGRGYALGAYAFLAALYFILIFSQEKENLINDFLAITGFILFSIVGFYTQVSFLYPFATALTIGVYFSWKNTIKLFRLFISVLIVIIFSILLYSPIIVFNGLESITNNPNIQLQSLGNNLWQIDRLIFDWYDWLFGVKRWGIYLISLFTLTGLILYLRNKDNPYIVVAFAILFIPYLVILVHGVFPFSRLMGFQLAGLAFILVSFFDKIRKRRGLIFIYSLIAVYFMVQAGEKQSKIDFAHDFQCQEMANRLAKSEITGSICAFETYFHNLKLYNEQMTFTEKAFIQSERVENYTVFEGLILSKSTALPDSVKNQFHIAYSDSFAHLWLKNRP